MMGYTEGQSGRDWELQTTVLASDLGLFDGLDGFIPSMVASILTASQRFRLLVGLKFPLSSPFMMPKA